MPKLEDDASLPQVPLAAKIAQSLTREARNSPIAWYRARQRGWTREQFERWVETGLEPGEQPAKRKVSDDEDERIGRF